MGRGGWFTEKEFNAYLSKHGIQHQNIVPHTPQQNGVVKRKNRTLVEMDRSMLYSKGLHNFFWIEVFFSDNHILNGFPTKLFLQVTPKLKMKRKDTRY